MQKKTVFIWIWILFTPPVFFTVNGQHNSAPFPLARYLFVKTFIVKATVQRVGSFEFHAKVDDWIRPHNYGKENIGVRYNISYQNRKENEKSICLEKSQTYIFLITLKSKGLDCMLFTDKTRFKVKGDSLCIGNYFLRDLEFDKHQINRKNPFDDPAMPEGYVISYHDFIQLINDVDSSFKWHPQYRTPEYVKTAGNSPFSIAVIDQLKNSICTGSVIERSDN